MVHITIEYDCTFTIDELWPDGDAPDLITRDAVLDLIKQEGIHRVASAWNFPTPSVHIGFRGFDEHGRRKHSETLLVRTSGESP